MSRPLPPEFETAPEFEGVKTGNVRVELKIRVATGYLGGGVEAGVGDGVTPFRAPAIRGALRWFWRATRGGAYSDYRTLKRWEDAIWGSTDGASAVRVSVRDEVAGTGVAAKRQENGRWVFEQPSYALFSAQQDRIGSIRKNGRFTLVLQFPRERTIGGLGAVSIADEVDAALRAWVNFGGVGARTRRGAGTLYCADYCGLDRWYNPVDYKGDGTRRDWYTFKGARVVMGKQRMPVQRAWEEAVRVLQEYRQWRTRQRGRSLWPEPDEIRRLRGQYAPQHREEMTADRVFPRGKLGLPIVFHFKTPGDPSPDNTLILSEESDRWASPVIVKPLMVSETEAVPMLLAMESPIPGELILRQGNRGGNDVKVQTGNGAVVRGLIEKAMREWGAPEYGL